MPDHPSWPAELVEKAAKALCEHEHPTGWDLTHEYRDAALAVLSALSGDLVPREEHEKHRHALIECARASGTDMSDGPPTWPPLYAWALQEVRRLRAESDECPAPEDLAEARSQADALAEALERIAGDKTPVADFHFAGRAEDREAAMIEIAREALAYRSSSSTETEG